MVRQHHNTTATPTTTLIAPPKRKKGRPSLQDIQQRKLFQQQLQLLQNNNNNNNNANNNNNNNNKKNDNHESEKQNPNSLPRRARSSRRTSNTLPAQFLLGSDSDSDYPISPDSPNSGSDSDSQDERTSKKVRRLSSSSSSSQGEKGSKATDSGNNETRKLVGPTYGSTSAASATALPDRKLLLPVLDKLQKKDTRGVFAEPVNPEELPDYDEVIERPMDFGTVREKLNRGQYRSMEQLEDDIYLICSNAMQYNSPSTIFFRQARSIQELAKKEFEILRQDAGQIELPPRPRRGRPPGSKNQKKPVESKPPDRSVSKSPSEATPVSREEDATRSGSYNLRKGPSLYRFPRHLDNYFDYSGSTPRFLSTMYGKKLCASDDNRRETYSMSSQFGFDQGSLATYGDPDKQLIAVGPTSDHGYARSLVRFAADLGPVAWRIVSKKLKAVLPPGVDFGPGWVDETKASPTQLPPVPENLVQPNFSLQDSFRSEPQHSLTSVFTNSAFAHRPSASCSENAGGGRDLSCSSEWSTLKGINGLIGPGSSFQTQPGPVTYPRMDGLGFASSSQFQDGMFRPTSSSFMNTSSTPHALAPSSFDASTSAAMNRMPSPPVDFHGMMNTTETEMGVQGTPYWQNLSMQERWDRPYSAELNGGFQASGSRNTSLPIGSPPQLDLVLQL